MEINSQKIKEKEKEIKQKIEYSAIFSKTLANLSSKFIDTIKNIVISVKKGFIFICDYKSIILEFKTFYKSVIDKNSKVFVILLFILYFIIFLELAFVLYYFFYLFFAFEIVIVLLIIVIIPTFFVILSFSRFNLGKSAISCFFAGLLYILLVFIIFFSFVQLFFPNLTLYNIYDTYVYKYGNGYIAKHALEKVEIWGLKKGNDVILGLDKDLEKKYSDHLRGVTIKYINLESIYIKSFPRKIYKIYYMGDILFIGDISRSYSNFNREYFGVVTYDANLEKIVNYTDYYKCDNGKKLDYIFQECKK